MKKGIRLLPFILLLFAGQLHASDLERRLDKIMERREFRHAFFGIEFYSLDAHKPVYKHNENVLFVPGSTTKLITAASALKLLGADYRFHTNIYRTGDITRDGVLEGDVILRASGDPNLSGRMKADGSLQFENEDHSYGGEESHGVAGDPLMVIRDFAKQVADHGIKRINGRVMVDASLFPQGDRELGTGVVLSPIVVNDNLVDVIVAPGPAEKSAAILTVAPQTSYVRILNQVKTVSTGDEADLRWESDTENSDGTRTVTLAGTIPIKAKPLMNAYPVADPARFAEIVLTEALRERGVVANARLKEDKADFKALSAFYTNDRRLAEHVSAPMTEEVKVLLKVSQNLHASMMPFLFSGLISKREAPQAGFDLIRLMLTSAKLDIDGASQSDGAGGSAHFTPAFIVSFLEWMSTQKEYQAFHDGLPILGRDGTLFEIQVNSPAAGHVHAKTGTYGDSDLLHRGLIVTGKGLAGYMTTKRGKKLAFAIYVNNVLLPLTPNAIRDVCGQALGEIAAAAYESE